MNIKGYYSFQILVSIENKFCTNIDGRCLDIEDLEYLRKHKGFQFYVDDVMIKGIQYATMYVYFFLLLKYGRN